MQEGSSHRRRAAILSERRCSEDLQVSLQERPARTMVRRRIQLGSQRTLLASDSAHRCSRQKQEVSHRSARICSALVRSTGPAPAYPLNLPCRAPSPSLGSPSNIRLSSSNNNRRLSSDIYVLRLITSNGTMLVGFVTNKSSFRVDVVSGVDTCLRLYI